MRWSQYFVNTLRESPSDAEVVSHKLMMRAGMIRKVAAGIYSYLPLGLRTLRKVETIVREEMNRAGAVELLMPAIQPAELWQESGRWSQYGKELLRIRDRHERDFVFGPTHEEVITDIVRDGLSSYRQLPVNLYQIQTKFRDEVRPRFGLMRGREFIMKDAYSFHTSPESLDATYEAMRDAYSRIFERCGLEHITVEADTGNIGGSSSHEFMVLAQLGEDAVVRCASCGYGANVEKAEMKRRASESGAEPVAMAEVSTPGMRTIDEVAAFLELPPSSIVKSVLYQTEDEIVMVLVPGDRDVNEVKVRNLLGAKHLTLLGEQKIAEVTGGPVGFSGPVSLEGVRIVADESIRTMSNFVVGANRADTHLRNVNLDRDVRLSEFGDFVIVGAGDLCPRCEHELEIFRGIEVGHVFKLGTKYSVSMNCVYIDEAGERKPMIMGCYGLGVGRTAASAIEQSHDDDGIIWPIPIAPFEVVVTMVGRDEPVRDQAEAIYRKLLERGIDVILDDRDERPGVKFKDADLIGIPIRITVGARALAEGNVEWSLRRDREKQLITPDAAIDAVVREVEAARQPRVP